MTRALRSAVPLAFVCLAVAACGATSHVRDSARNAAALGPCPRHVQTIRQAPTSRNHVRAFVPRNPIAAELCVYSLLGKYGSLAVLKASALLSAPRARTLTLMVDSRGRGPSCDVGFPVLMQLRYRTGRVFSALASGCDPELLSTQTGTEVLSPTASLAVGGLLDPPLNPGGHVTRVFDYIGQRLATAVTAARRHLKATAGEVHVTLYELADPGAPFEQVVWQTPLSGTEQDAASGSIGLVVTIHRAPTCRADQLLGRYANGGDGTGDHFGNIDLLNTSPRACSLNGRLTLHGIGTDGQPDTSTVSEPVGPVLVLSPKTTLRTLEHDPASALIVTFGFAGDARDDPQAPNGLCYDHETTPKAWALTLNTSTTLRIPNGAPGEGGPFYSCHGSLSLALSRGVQLLGS